MFALPSAVWATTMAGGVSGLPGEYELELGFELLMMPAVIAAVKTAVTAIAPATITQVRRQSGIDPSGGGDGAGEAVGEGAMIDGGATGWLEDRRAAMSVST